MAVLFIIVSIVYYAARNTLEPWLALIPADVFGQLKLWQVVTYSCLFQASPGSFIFGALILVSIGGALESQWGWKRLWAFSFGIAILTGLLIVLLGFLVRPLAGQPFVGGADAIFQSMWVAYGLMLGRGRTNFWGVLPTNGYTLALIGAAFVLLSGLLNSW